MYRLNGSSVNLPADGGEYGQLIVSRGADTITQIYGSYANGNLYTRSGNPSDVGGAGSWHGWYKLWHDGIFNPDLKANLASPSLTGNVSVAKAMTDYALPFNNVHLALETTNTVDNSGFVGISYASSTAANYGWTAGALRSPSAVSDFIFKNHNNSEAGVERFRITSDGIVKVNGSSTVYHTGNFDPSLKANLASPIFTGTVTAPVLNVNGTTTITKTGNGAELLKFATERPWSFSQASTGASTELRLNDLNGSKIFRIYDTINGGNIIFSNGAIVASGEVTAYSDRRIKSNIQALKVRGDLNPVTYTKDGKASIGFIAQEVKEIYPELVVGDEGKEMLSLNYQQLTAVLYAEIKELKERIKKLEGENK